MGFPLETLLPRVRHVVVRIEQTDLFAASERRCARVTNSSVIRIGVLSAREIVTVPMTLTLYRSTENDKLPPTDASRCIRRVANR